MPTPVVFSPEMESRVRFVEDTPPAEIVERTLSMLRGGEAPEQLLAAAALAVSRSTEIPSNHHGGPVHPVSGAHAIMGVAQLMPGESAVLPIVQSVALANKHVHAPDMGPALMVDLEPQSAGGVAATEEAFASAIHHRIPLTAERHLMWLLQNVSSGRVIDLMLGAALRRNALDDHYFLYPLFTARALDDLGWEYASVLLRPPVRYLARHPIMDAVPPFSAEYIARNVAIYDTFDVLERLIDDHRLLDGNLALTANEDEGAAIGALADRIGALDDYSEIPGMLAADMAGGLSLEGAGEALSVGAALLWLRSDSGNPFDVHHHTGVNVRRYILGLRDVSLRNKLLALFTWATGPEVRDQQRKMRWTARAPADTIAGMPNRSQAELLDAIVGACLDLPAVDMEAEGVRVNEIYVGKPVRQISALAQQYSELGYDPAAFFERIAQLVCRDDYSEMHAYKMLQAAREEYYATREDFRWVHLVSAARHVGSVIGLEPKPVFRRARELMGEPAVVSAS
jgi:hypothetical protein